MVINHFKDTYQSNVNQYLTLILESTEVEFIDYILFSNQHL